LEGLKWDGVSRIDSWLTQFASARDTEYTKAVSRFFLVGMVKRVFEPGCKFDYALIFEGLQGVGKSRFFAALGGQWFSDSDLDLNNKDSMAALAGNWLHEFAELSSFSRADQNKIKSFLSRQVDEYRPVYERRHVKVPRQIAFCGSTNEMEYFDDPTGARRFWPVKCTGRLDPEGLAAIRDQLFAEAYHLYLQGERCFPTPGQQASLFDPEQIRRQRSDPLEEPIRDFLQEKQDAVNEEFTMDQLLEKIFSGDRSKWAPTASVRVGKILARMGCSKVERRLSEHRHVYKPPKKSAMNTSDAQAHQGDEDGYDVPF
jgi:predicted P-loop ATPase